MRLEHTDKTNYITGMTALNIPDKNGNFADWHFVETFLSGRGKLFISGENMATTHDVFGGYGIRECSQVLRRMGVSLPSRSKVYAANFVRAILDLLHETVQKKKNPQYITLDDLLDDEDLKQEFFDRLIALKKYIKDKE